MPREIEERLNEHYSKRRMNDKFEGLTWLGRVGVQGIAGLGYRQFFGGRSLVVVGGGVKFVGMGWGDKSILKVKCVSCFIQRKIN